MEDWTAMKLKGYNCIIKFKDGEELALKVELDQCDESDFFEDLERFINMPDYQISALTGIALSRDTIKYIRKL